MAQEKEPEIQLEEAAEQESAETAQENTAQAQENGECLEASLEQKERQLQESQDRIKRLQADFDNFRRRTRQEKEELSAVVAQTLIKDLLPLLDNFQRALSVQAADEAGSFKDGVDMIYKQLLAALERNGMEKIDAVGKKFDPNFHEAVMRVSDADKEDDVVLEEMQCGYSVHGRVIRPTMVKVVSN